MPFSQKTLRRCWKLAQGRCECQRENHGHEGRCNRPMVFERHGFLGPEGWYAGAWTGLNGGRDEPENCEAVCSECFRQLGAEREGKT